VTDDDGVPEHITLPDDFNLRSADRGAHVTDSEGRRWVVLESRLHDERRLVRADLVEYETLDHPAVMGAAGMGVILAAFLAPIAGAYGVSASLALPTIWGVTAATAGVLGGWALSNVLLARTVVGDEVYRFLEWNDYRGAIIAQRQATQNGGEAA
jgi:hypothetical protein